ncbi:MAG: precorrin-3B C(17)-methyltransferase [Alphaproteobacteria bacterium]
MTAIIALTAEGSALAKRLQEVIPGAVTFGKTGRADGLDQAFDDVQALMQAKYLEGTPVVAIMAAAIPVRLLALLLGDKFNEPPVIAISQDGASVVPLLGGHRGANRLAMKIAAATGGHAAVTTAGDIDLGFALDDPPSGWVVANPEMIKPVTAALLAGEKVALKHKAGPGDWPPPERFSDGGEQAVLITDRLNAIPPATLVLHPPVLTVGVGCERGIPAAEGVAAVQQVLTAQGYASSSVVAVGSVDLKVDEPAVLAAARSLGCDARFFTVDALEAETPRLKNPSDVVLQEIGCHGVAEAAALALAGPDAVLAVEKQRIGKVTVAIAKAPRIEAAASGRASGRLFVVGTGPGQAAWRTGESVKALKAADTVVGYGLYLDLVSDLIAGKERLESPLGAEEDRVRLALEAAATGKTVALVCSGDPGIYALATLVFEVLEKSDDRAVRGVEVSVCPGVSAFQAASARLGAPMGHDFCLISLSDLLTPREAILKRLDAAAEADFVTAFYNPQSLRRRSLLGEARDRIARHRPADTPVAIARSLGRPEEYVEITTIGEFDTESVDMLSLVVIGNSETRRVDVAGRTFVYTPRGYAQKSAKKGAA